MLNTKYTVIEHSENASPIKFNKPVKPQFSCILFACCVNYVYIPAIMCPRKNEIIQINTQEEANTHISFVLHYIHRTPSMTAKLPNMVMNRVDAIMEFLRKNNKNA